MKKLFTAFATIVLAVGLPSAAFANEIVEISVQASDTNDDKCDVEAKGPDIDDLAGFVEIFCVASGLKSRQEICDSDHHDPCQIHIIGCGDPAVSVEINVCRTRPSTTCQLGPSCRVTGEPRSNRPDAKAGTTIKLK